MTESLSHLPPAYYSDDLVTLYHGDCLDVLRELPDNSVDAVTTDPPYGLEFMGKAWDRPWARDFTGINGSAPLPDRQLHVNPRCKACGGYQRGTKKPCACESPEWSDSQSAAVGRANRGFQEWCEQWATECLRVLKPGGYMLAFGGSRTWHRLAAAVEDAGFEIRDSIAWLYGSGFPKSLDVSKAIDKAAGADREVVGRYVPPNGNVWNLANDEARSEVGAVGHSSRSASLDLTAPATEAAQQWQGWGTALKPAFEPIVVARKPLTGTVAANMLEHGTGALNIDGCRVHADDAQAGRVRHGGGTNTVYQDQEWSARTADRGNEMPAGRWPTNVVLDDTQAAELDKQTGFQRDGVAVNRNKDAEAVKPASVYGTYLNGSQPDRTYGGGGGASRFFPTFHYEAKAPSSERPRNGETAHPTVKPLDLMRWLVRLVTPPGGTVLEPFAGSGTTAEACVIEGFKCVAIEREADYLPLIVARLSKPIQAALDFGEVS